MKTNLADPAHTETFLTPAELMRRWKCTRQTLLRRTKDGTLKPVRLTSHFHRFRLSDILAIEAAAQ